MEKEKKWDVYIYGDVNIDLVVPDVSQLPDPGTEVEVPQMQTFVGGGAALFLMGIAKLGLHPVFQGSLGNDMYGSWIRDTFISLGIDDSLLETDAVRQTGISISFTDEHDRCFLTYRGTNETISLCNLNLEQAIQARHLHVTGYMGRKNHDEYYQVLKSVKEKSNTTISFDAGWDASQEWYEGYFDLLPYIDIVFLNETECLHYAHMESMEQVEKALEKFHAAKTVVVKLGSKGALAYSDGKIYKADAFPVQPVDTTGAGDSFNAGFVAARLLGMDLQKSLIVGNACGGLSVTCNGGNTGFPTMPVLREFLAQKGISL